MAIKHPNGCHCGESRNPEKYWMPCQVRHDVAETLCCQSNRIGVQIILQLLVTPLIIAIFVLDFIITLVQYFHSYDTHDGGPKVRKTTPRLIYIRKIPQIGGWFKADYKGEIDHEDDGDYSSTLELQLGKIFTPRIGAYVEGLIGDDAFETKY